MKKTKLLLLASILLLSFSMTGCKFIEKAPEKEESSQTSTIEENLGDIDENVKIPEKVKDTTSNTETTESTAGTPNQRVISGITFNVLSAQQTKYAVSNIQLFDEPSSKANVVYEINEGQPLSVYAISDDGKWIMCKNSNIKMSYTLSAGLTDKYIEKFEETPETTENSSQSESSAPNESTKPSSSKTESSKSEAANSSSSSSKEESHAPSSQEPSSSSPQEQTQPSSSESKSPSSSSSSEVVEGYLTDGIPYPDNPSSTSINLGVEFADVNEILYVTIDKTTANSGPGAAISSTGYTVKATFKAGTAVQCTGIGKNGYIRVELANSVIAFIDGRHLERR